MGGKHTKAARGGRRPGAGRKPILNDPVRFTMDLESSDFAALEMIAKDRDVSTASLLRQLVRSYLKRRER